MPTKIEWCDETWNIAMGCTPVSTGCNNCFARTMIKRFAGRPGWPKSPGEVTLFPERLEQPFKWRKPRRVFVNSMSDLFHQDVPLIFIAKMFSVMAANSEHTFQILTKRPVRMKEWFIWYDNLRCSPHDYHAQLRIEIGNLPLPNVWLGVSVEDQETADERIPILLETPAAKRFVSYEPALGPIKVLQDCQVCKGRGWFDNGPLDQFKCENCNDVGQLIGLDLVICGAETGPGARPMDINWARYVRDQCKAAKVPFFFKRDSEGSHNLDGEKWEEMPK